MELRNKYIGNGVFISQLPVSTFTEIVIEFDMKLTPRFFMSNRLPIPQGAKLGSSWAAICPRRLLLKDFLDRESPSTSKRRPNKDVRFACICFRGASPQFSYPFRVSPEEVIRLASNQEQAVKDAATPLQAAQAYVKYVQSMEAEGQTPKDIRDL